MRPLLLRLALVLVALTAAGQTPTENYIKTTSYRVETATGAVVNDDKMETVTYYDGLGRPVQHVDVRAGGLHEDIVTHIGYDAYGRQDKDYLPYATATNGGLYRIDALNATGSFYNTTKYENTLNPYSEKHFEDSPLNRVLELGAPGTDWIVNSTIDTDHTIKFGYGSNTDADFVRQFGVSFIGGNTEAPQLQDDGLYQAGILYKTVTRDENWQPGQAYPMDHTTEEYKNKQGRVILKRTFESGGWHDTYYVYDDYGNLTYVLPPMVRTYQSIKQIWHDDPYHRQDVDFYQGTYQNTLAWFRISVDDGLLSFTMFAMTDTTGLILKNGLVQTMDMPTELPDLSLGNITITNTSGQSVVGATARIENGDLYFTSTGEQLQGTGFVYTYSVDISNLQNTITPPGIGPANFDGFAYQYKYDDRNRLTEKKIPGKDWEYIVYDNLDRPVMTQDANQRAKSPKEWSFTKYDALGRPAYTGLYRSDLPISIIRNIFKNNTAPQNYETKVALGSGYDGTYYTNDNFPTSSIEVLTVNYYDDYTFDMATLSLPASYEGQDIINYNNASGTKKGTKGLATGSKVKVLETTDWITNVTGYDKKGRPIYVASNNAYLGTIDIARSRLDFTGNVEKTETAHTKDGTTISTEDLFTYDHMNRLITQKQNINGQGQELIAKNRYDELGQLIGKEVGNTEASPLQDVDYSYTVRGWLKTINNPYSLSENNDLFAFGISYNETDLKSQYANYDTPLYNGNISQLRWRSENTDRSIRHYTLIYDALNRMESSYSATNYAIDLKFREHIYGYDKNGNIESLYRTMQDDSATNGYSYIDNLEYDYTGNQLLSVTDSYGLSGMGAEGFMDSNIVGDDYRYDANGNMLVDLNKGIGTVMADGITYNHLNLPTYIEINDGNDNVGNITYIYDALGNKQTKGVMHIGTYNSLTTTYYAGNYVYQGNFMSGGCSGCPPPPPPTPIWLKFINQPEGYIEPKNELDLSQGFDYVYRYRDHLGNIRLSYKDSNEDGSITGGSTQIFFDDFETASGWDGTGASWGHPISSFDSNFKLQGNYAGRIDRTGSSSVAVHSLTWVPINNSSDTEYIYSGWAYSNGPTIRLGLAMKEAGETGYLTLFDDIYVGTKNTWVYVEKRVIVPANMVLINLRIEANSSNVNGTVWWDNVSIRKVNDLLAVEILEENNYYPFGLKHKGYNTNVTSTNLALKYKFGGKEYQDELGLDWYDVSARNYDPALGRWMNLDPLAEKMRRHSPYNYAFDNPIYFIDYDGMMPTGPGDPPKKKLQNAIIAIGEAVTDGLETIGSWFTSDNSSPSNRTSERLDVEGEGIRIWGNNKTNEGSTADNGDSKGSLETKDIPSAPGGHKGTGKTPVTALKGGLKDTQKVESFFERGNDIVDSNKSENSVEKWDGSFATSTSKSNERGDNPIIVTKYFSISGTDTNFTTQTESYRTLDAKADSTLTVNNSWPTPRREDSSIVVDSVTIQY